MNSDAHSPLSRRAVIVWACAALFYIVAVTGRTSFGVAGITAIDRFEVDAARIAVFTAVQLAVYSTAQMPVGLLIDRFGPRRVLVTGAFIMAIGQLILGLTTSYGVAIGARILIGAGDASAFLSVMRLIPNWIPPRKTPIFTQLTAGLGQLGQFLSAVPFLAVLSTQGWTPAFVGLGAVGVLVALAAGLAVADAPASAQPKKPAPHPPFSATLRTVLSHPVCWQAFFIHYSGMMLQVVFTLLWGVPLMSLGMGLSNGQVGLALSLNTAANIMAVPLMGIISQRMGYSRDIAVLVLAGTLGASWMIFLAPEQPRGFAAAIILNVLMGSLCLSSNFGFDSVRSRVPREIVATGTGLGNMGGFISAMVAAQMVGVLLDASSNGAQYQWQDFRVAWVAPLAIWGVGMAGIVLTRVWTKRWEKRSGNTTRVRVVDQSPETK
ncbi:MFS transporter [Corynebacterium tapiri]|uniref:MFS transporter n=1 Tax=Corynebacterium tapiri TaxID=1448266 RepID=A0A5C4U4M0_9CORY|nr:MFS transporter [Corynebacterium tapiri]TNL98728.1 MFS transporter [Corynebacterium tapiri]